MPPPEPPSVKAGRMIAGRPISFRNASGVVERVDGLGLGELEAAFSQMSLKPGGPRRGG
jgi:hypothetical protein